MNANAEFDSLLWQNVLITVAHAVLYFRGATLPRRGEGNMGCQTATRVPSIET
jgi:hypothetical protein